MINFLRIANNIKLGDYLHQNGTIDNIPSSDIIGICVIPSNFLPDKYARFISSSNIQNLITWDDKIKIELKANQYKYLPTKKGKEIFGYFRETNDPLLSFISPYLSDNSFNPDFLRDLEGGNAFQDYRGYENTRLYKEKYKDLKDTNAFTACFQIAPLYKKEDWYLPAIGELAFIPPRFEMIAEKMEKVSHEGQQLINRSHFYWSSTETNNNRVWYLGLSLNTGFLGIDNGVTSLISKSYKIFSNLVRSFLAL